jgi:hypothetical protein
MDAEVSTHTFLTMIIEESVCFMACEPIFFPPIILMWYTRNIYNFFSNMKGKYLGIFWLNIFTYICHLILTKINCITLKICSKAEFKSKLQNIWQQIILFSRTVMQRICTWPKIWTPSGRLSLMRNVQLMKKNKNIFRVILCITVRENRIICCQIFYNLLLNSAFEQIFNVMQLILVKIKWHI